MEVSDSLDETRPTRGRRLTQRLSRRLFWLPTLFTVGNLFCGYLSIWRSIQGAFEAAAVLIIAAAVLDALDGRVARWTHSTSEFGEEYDSLADLVSFGVAPAVLAYSWGLSDFPRPGFVASFLFVVCGSMRLARFNIQTKVADKRYFVGLPIPAAAGTIATLVLATPERLVERVWMAGLLVLTVVLSYLMISTIRYRSFKEHLDLKRPLRLWVLPLIALVLALVRLWPALFLLCVALVFAASGPVAKLVGFLRRKRARSKEQGARSKEQGARSKELYIRSDIIPFRSYSSLLASRSSLLPRYFLSGVGIGASDVTSCPDAESTW